MKLNSLQKFYLLIQIKQVLQFNKEKIQYPHRMYGSFLNFQTIKLIRPYLIAAYGTQYYIFDTNTQLCMSQINIGHQSKILCSTVVGAKNQYNLFSLDSSGLFVRVEIKFQVPGSDQQQRSGIKFDVLQKSIIIPKNKKEIVTITSATFVDQNCILFINSHKKLQRYDVQNNSLSNIAYQSSFSQIKHNKDQSYLFLIEQDKQNMKVYSKQSHSIHQSYIHHTIITSCAFTNQILIIGDSKGKITLLYQFLNQNKKKSKKQKLSSTLEWHTGPVLSLCSNGQYIYSAGQQSVVVLWHLRDLSRDFLPRVRTSINYLTVNIQTNEIICGLSDNSIKIIDLSRDKQTRTYRTIVDPQGYAPNGSSRFSNYTTNYKDGLLCLNSVPGKLQFLNFNKNGENVQLQIVPRNLINSIDEDKVSPHRIFCTSFSQDWSTLLTSLNIDNNSSYLKFYHKGVQGYQLINKIQNPHLGLTKACLSIGNKKLNKFITYSLKDQVIRVWQQFRQKKKSIIDSSEVFWKYSQQIRHRNLFPTFVSCYKSFIIIIYNNIQIVLYQLKQTGLTQSIETMTTHYKIQQVFIIQCEIYKSKRNIKLLLVTKQLDFQIVNYSQQKKQQKINILSQIHLNKNISSYFITPGLKQIVLVAKNSQKSCQIVTLDRKLTKFTQIFDCDTFIQSAFWIQDRLMVITEDLTISSLDGKQFVKFTQKDGTQIHQMSQQTTEIKVLGQDIFKINSRWVERQTLKDKKKTSDNLQGLGLFPNCKSAWEQISFKLLI